MAPHISFSILKEMLGLKIKFNVTPKEADEHNGYFQFKAAGAHIFLFIMTICALTIGIFKRNANSINIFSIIINAAWAIYNLYGIVVSILVSYQKPNKIPIENIDISSELSNTKPVRNVHHHECVVTDFCSEKTLIKYTGGENIKVGDRILFNLKDDISIHSTVDLCTGHNHFHLSFDSEHDIDIIKAICEMYTENMTPFYDVEIDQQYINSTAAL